MELSVIGILISLVIIIVLALRGVGIIVIAPLAVVIVSLFSHMDAGAALMGPYMKGFVSYATKFYLVFLFASIFGKFMDDSGAARSIALKVISLTGKNNALMVLCAISAITLLLTMGGVSLFVVIFAVLPIARPLFKELDIPWHLFVAAFIFGIGSISMTTMPGTPSILNVMPTKYLGTTTMAAPLLGIIGTLILGAFNVWYMSAQLKKSRARGEGYEASAGKVATQEQDAGKALPNVWLSLAPSVVLVLALNALKIDIVWSLVAGCVVAALLFWKYVDKPLATLNAGATNMAVPIINTCADVGYGTVVAATAGFKVITEFLFAIPGTPVISLSLATYLMTGITGSASGGLGIVLETLMPKYQALGIHPEFLHRIVTMASGTFDAMPHNGVIITTLAVAGLTHRQAYRHVWWGHVVATFIAMLVVIPVGLLIYR
jgi:H+/gluconate symporter-like permease